MIDLQHHLLKLLKAFALPLVIAAALVLLIVGDAVGRHWWAFAADVLVLTVGAAIALVAGIVRKNAKPAAEGETAPEPEEAAFDADGAANAIAEGLATYRHALTPLDEATLGYRRQLEGDGWSPTAAEEMALTFYGTQARAIERAFGVGATTQEQERK